MSKSVKVWGVFYATVNGIKLGSRGRVLPTAQVLKGMIDKGSRRRLRKALRAAGFKGHAATKV